MPIDTRLDGRPESVQATARWLRTHLAFEVKAGAAAMNSARADAGTGWQGAAGTAFQQRAAGHTATAETLRADIERAADRLTEFADQLAVAQQHMANAREIAARGGLTVDGYVIQEPGSGPAPAGQQQQVEAYALAEREAGLGNAVWRFVLDVLKNMMDDLRQKWFFAFGDLANGTYGGFLKKHISILLADAKEAAEQVKKLEAAYLKSQGGSAHSKSLINLISEQKLAAAATEARASSLSTGLLKKVPLIGYAITAAGVGYDIQHGKPAVKAVVGGLASIGGSIGGGILGGAAAGAIGAGPVGLVVGGAIGGVIGGLAASGITDAVYDRLPEGVKDTFDDGQAIVGKALSDAGGEVKELWNKIF
ncbi:WXG100 family type VII secretion target [Actinoplanes subglobosus]|uniref:WXG100 family type VII secretion target n=1 Tax=Actinoplanes subglobosus TaxID=1547892 RepID=A0ABV8IZC7_9ACTN